MDRIGTRPNAWCVGWTFERSQARPRRTGWHPPLRWAIAFRPIAVPSGGGVLDDRTIQLGNPDAELGFNEYQRGAFLAAPFRSTDNARFLYLGNKM